MTDRSNYQRVGIETDEQSFDRLTQRVNSVVAQTQRLNDANIQVADSAQKAGVSLQKAFQSFQQHIDENIKSVQELRNELTKLDVDEKGFTAAGRESYAQHVGYGAEGGLIGPAAPPPDNSADSIGGLRRSASILNRVSPGLGTPLELAGAAQQLDKTFGGITKAISNLGDETAPVTAVIKGLGGDLGVVAVAGGLAVAAIGGIVLAASAFKATLDEGSKGLGDAVTYVDAYYKAIEKGTTDSINLQLKELQGQQIINQEKEKTLQASYDAAHPKVNLTNGQDVDFGALVGSISDLSAGGKQLNKDLEDTKNAVKANDIQQQALTAALKSTEVAANDAALAEEKLQAARDSAAEKHIQQVVQTAQLEASGTTKQIQDRLAAIKVERDAINDQIRVGNLSAEETAKLDQRFHDLTDEMERDEKVIGPLIAARERQTAADKDATKAAQDRLAADKKRDQDSVAAFDKYTTAVQSAEDSAATARLNANQKLQDALVSAAEKAVDDANKALDQLTQKRQENLTSFTRDEEKATRDAADQQVADQIKAQRQERDDLQTHLDNLKQIRDRDAGRERDDLLNRNYRDLFSLKEQKKQDLTTENDRYNTQAQQRNQALQDEQSDQARAAQVQRRERLISYQQANADALKQYNIEIETAQHAKAKAIQVAQQSYQKELTLINQNLVLKEKILRQDAINEIKLVQQTEDQKMVIFKSKLQQVNDLLGVANTVNNAAATHSGTSTHAIPFAEGGYASAGQLTKVNDGRKGQRESFNGVPFPPGLGMFIPAHSGYIDSGSKNSGPITLSPVYQITGVDAKQVVEIADARNRKLMKDVGLIK